MSGNLNEILLVRRLLWNKPGHCAIWVRCDVLGGGGGITHIAEIHNVLWAERAHAHHHASSLLYRRTQGGLVPESRGTAIRQTSVRSEIKRAPAAWVRPLHCCRCFTLALESLQVYTGGVNHCFTMSRFARRAYILEPLINQELHFKHSESFPFQAETFYNNRELNWSELQDLNLRLGHFWRLICDQERKRTSSGTKKILIMTSGKCILSVHVSPEQKQNEIAH